MQLNLHANATATPRMRAYIQSSTASVAGLVAELGVSDRTVRRWRGRNQDCRPLASAKADGD